MRYVALCLLFVVGAGSLMAQAEQGLTLKNGSSLHGALTGAEDGKLAFEDSSLGKVLVPGDAIADADFPGPLTFHYQRTRHDTIHQGQLSARNGKLTFKDEAGNESYDPLAFYRFESTPFSLWESSGNIGSFFSWSEGNTKEINYGLDANVSFRHPVHVIDLAASALFGEEDRERSDQEFRFDGQYAYMFSEHVGAYGRETIQHDDFQDLRVRTVTAAGATFPLVSENTYELRANLGVTYTTESYKTAANREFAGLEGALQGFWDLGEETQFRGEFRVNVSLEDTEDSVYDLRLSLVHQLISSVTVSAIAEYEYENLPAPGVERADTRLAVLLGIAF